MILGMLQRAMCKIIPSIKVQFLYKHQISTVHCVYIVLMTILNCVTDVQQCMAAY